MPGSVEITSSFTAMSFTTARLCGPVQPPLGAHLDRPRRHLQFIVLHSCRMAAPEGGWTKTIVAKGGDAGDAAAADSALPVRALPPGAIADSAGLDVEEAKNGGGGTAGAGPGGGGDDRPQRDEERRFSRVMVRHCGPA